MPVIESDMQATRTGKILRIQTLKELIKKNQKMPEIELVKFIMNRWMLSKQVADRYVDELVSAGIIKRSTDLNVQYVEST